jgi:cytochrome c biogenesis protein CcdA
VSRVIESKPSGNAWVPGMIVAGLIYATVGIAVAWPTAHVVGWRFGAWIVSAVAYAAHIGYERIRLQSAPARAARHVALGVALGAFGLAAGANIHSLSVASSARQHTLLLVALVAWPLITSLPAFAVALGLSAALKRAGISATRPAA